jgi:5-formyltetrahydrofolate cyclo-ligase
VVPTSTLDSRKKQLRDRMTQVRDSISADQALAAGEAIADRLAVWSSWRSSTVVALFATLSGEVDTQPLFELARRDGKQILFPRMLAARTLEFAVVEEIGSLWTGRYGVLEPGHGSRVETLHANAIVLVPGVAFDRGGGRLGRGAGYYDRALAELGGKSRRPQFIGVGFESQIVPFVPMSSLDMRMDVVVTELGLFAVE